MTVRYTVQYSSQFIKVDPTVSIQQDIIEPILYTHNTLSSFLICKHN